MIASRSRRDPALQLAEQLDELAAAARRQQALRWGLGAFAAGVFLDAALLTAERLVPFLLPPIVLAGPPLLLLVCAALAGLLRRPDDFALARHTDRQMHLQERLVTAVELNRRKANQTLDALQLADTIDHLRRQPPTRAFPLAVDRHHIALLALSSACLVLLLALPKPAASVTADQARVQEAIAQEAERVTALAGDIENGGDRETVDEATRSAIAEALRDAAQSLQQQADSPERAVAALSQAQESISRMRAEESQDPGQALAGAAQGLQGDSATRDAASKLAQGDAQAAAQNLRSLGEAAAGMSDAQRASAAQAMRSAGANAGNSDPKLGESLRQAGDALASGDAQAKEALDRAASAVEQTAQQAANQELAEKAMSQLENSRAAIGKAAETPGAEKPRTDAGRGVKAADQNAQRNGPSNRGPSASAKPDGAEGQQIAPGQDGAGSADGQQGAQGEQGAQGQQGQQGGGAGDGTQEQSTDSFDPDALKTRIEQIAGADFENPSVSSSDRTGLPNSGQATADYRDVYAAYQDRATAAMQDRYVPLDMKQLVKDYFSALDPSR